MDFKAWYNRFQNLMDIQKSEQIEFISTRFSRNELIELRNLMAACVEHEDDRK